MAKEKTDKGEEKEEGEGAKEQAPKGKKRLFIIIGAVALLLLAVGVPLAMLGGNKSAKEEGTGHDQTPHEEEHLALAKLDPFIVNLSENTAFLKVTILLEYDLKLLEKAAGHATGGGGAYGGGGAGGGKAEANALPPLMKEREPMIRDAVIRVLSSKKSEEVLTLEGKEALKDELIEAINEAIGLEEGPVVNLYFTEFIVQ